MQLWKKFQQLAVTQMLTLARGAVLKGTDASGNPIGVPLPVAETRTAASTLTAEENGKVIFLSSATEFATTLPAPAAGLQFTFIVAAAPSGADYTIVSGSSSNIVKGAIFTTDVNSATDADLETSGGDTISFVSAKAVAGDRVVMYCDGTNWFAHGFCTVFDSITITTAS